MLILKAFVVVRLLLSDETKKLDLLQLFGKNYKIPAVAIDVYGCC